MEECVCDDCLAIYESDEYSEWGSWEYEHYTCQNLEFGHLLHNQVERENLENLQERLMEQLLGKELAARVKLRFGVLSNQAHPDEPGPSRMFLYLASVGRFHHWSANWDEGKFLVQEMEPSASPSELESWAFYKVSKLLGFEDVEPKFIVAWENSFQRMW